MSNIPTAQPSAAETVVAKTARLMSLDALRGFDMFWIVARMHWSAACTSSPKVLRTT